MSTQELDRMRHLDPANRTHLAGYIRHLELEQLKATTIRTKVWRIHSLFRDTGYQDATALRREDIEDYFIQRRKDVSAFTLQGDILESKLFFRWLDPEQEKELFKNIKMKKPRRQLPVDQLISRTDITRLVEACEKPRDRALIMLMWDSGARISEILGLNIGHVQFDQYGAVVIVSGKTGMRRLRLISSVPDIQTWVNIHPLRHDASSPLFITSRTYAGTPRRLSARTVENRLKHLSKQLKITKPIHPHAIRHARLTDLVRADGTRKGLSEMELRLVAGWEKNSSMPEVYVHLSGGDVERKMLENAGLIDVDRKGPSTLEPMMCPRCRSMNSFDAIYCAKCSMALNELAAMKVERSTDEAKGSEEYRMLVERLKRDLGMG